MSIYSFQREKANLIRRTISSNNLFHPTPIFQVLTNNWNYITTQSLSAFFNKHLKTMTGQSAQMFINEFSQNPQIGMNFSDFEDLILDRIDNDISKNAKERWKQQDNSQVGENEEKLVIHLIRQELKMLFDVNQFRSKCQQKLNWNCISIYDDIDSKDIEGIDFEQMKTFMKYNKIKFNHPNYKSLLSRAFRNCNNQIISKQQFLESNLFHPFTPINQIKIIPKPIPSPFIPLKNIHIQHSKSTTQLITKQTLPIHPSPQFLAKSLLKQQNSNKQLNQNSSKPSQVNFQSTGNFSYNNNNSTDRDNSPLPIQQLYPSNQQFFSTPQQQTFSPDQFPNTSHQQNQNVREEFITSDSDEDDKRLIQQINLHTKSAFHTKDQSNIPKSVTLNIPNPSPLSRCQLKSGRTNSGSTKDIFQQEKERKSPLKQMVHPQAIDKLMKNGINQTIGTQNNISQYTQQNEMKVSQGLGKENNNINSRIFESRVIYGQGKEENNEKRNNQKDGKSFQSSNQQLTMKVKGKSIYHVANDNGSIKDSKNN